jgi:hypothetical protein
MLRIVLVVAIVLFLGALFVADAQVRPGVEPVVVDGRGNRIGSVVSVAPSNNQFGLFGYPPWVSLQLMDGRFVAIPVYRSNFGQAFPLFFFSPNCTGPAYIPLFNVPPNLWAPAVVLPPGTSGNEAQLLYVAPNNATPFEASGYELLGGQCFPSGGPVPVVPASVAADLAVQFRPPYSIKGGTGQ